MPSLIVKPSEVSHVRSQIIIEVTEESFDHSSEGSLEQTVMSTDLESLESASSKGLPEIILQQPSTPVAPGQPHHIFIRQTCQT